MRMIKRSTLKSLYAGQVTVDLVEVYCFCKYSRDPFCPKEHWLGRFEDVAKVIKIGEITSKTHTLFKYVVLNTFYPVDMEVVETIGREPTELLIKFKNFEYKATIFETQKGLKVFSYAEIVYHNMSCYVLVFPMDNRVLPVINESRVYFIDPVEPEVKLYNPITAELKNLVVCNRVYQASGFICGLYNFEELQRDLQLDYPVCFHLPETPEVYFLDPREQSYLIRPLDQLL